MNRKSILLMSLTIIVMLGIVVGIAFMCSKFIMRPYNTIVTMILSYLTGSCANVVITHIIEKEGGQNEE